MPALTLIEAAKTRPPDLTRGVVETFAQNSPILAVLPFETVPGGGRRYEVEESLPGIGFRGVHETYTPTMGRTNPQYEPLVIVGGHIDVDNHIIRTQGESRRAGETLRQIKALALAWTQVFFKGDAVTDKRQFDGLQNRIQGTQLISAGPTAGGAAVSMFLLDELISLVEGNNKMLLMNGRLKRRLSAAARDAGVGGYIQFRPDELGREILYFNGIKVLEIERDNLNNEILPFSEVAEGGGSTASSIYCVSMGEGEVMGIQSGDVVVQDLGDMKSEPVQRTRVEWDCGFGIFHPHAAARMHSCGDLAFVP